MDQHLSKLAQVFLNQAECPPPGSCNCPGYARLRKRAAASSTARAAYFRDLRRQALAELAANESGQPTELVVLPHLSLTLTEDMLPPAIDLCSSCHKLQDEVGTRHGLLSGWCIQCSACRSRCTP
jgi:hypothetical protein